MTETKGFFASLFDLSFNWPVTTKVIKVIYVINIVFIALGAVFWVVVAFSRSSAFGALMLLVGAPLFSLFSLVYARVILEFFSSVVRIMENSRDLLAIARVQTGNGGFAATPSASPTRASTTPASTTPMYRIGDVVNGHRFDGAAWVPE